MNRIAPFWLGAARHDLSSRESPFPKEWSRLDFAVLLRFILPPRFPATTSFRAVNPALEEL
jgi:hypothetical protein